MKRILSTLIVIWCALSISSHNITFADTNVKSICVANWDTNGDGELSEAEATAVTELGEVFRENTDIVSFNELQYFTGLTKIDDYAFYGCSHLTVTIPNSVTSIGDFSLAGCFGLKSMTIPNSVTSIGDYAFYSCSMLSDLDIPNSVNSIGEGAFCDCHRLKEINIPYSIRTIKESTFTNCQALERVIIPRSVTAIEDEAFACCYALKIIIIPNSVSSIGRMAFWGSGLTSVDIPSSIKSIGTEAFKGCNDLHYVKMESSTPIIITEDVFSSKNEITLYVPEESKDAYQAADYWKDFGIIQEMANGDYTYTDYNNLKWYCYLSHGEVTLVNFYDDGEEVEYFPCVEGTIPSQLTIPSTVTIKSVNFPVREIGSCAFYEFSDLESVTIPNTVECFGLGAFYGCTNLNSINIHSLTAWCNIYYWDVQCNPLFRAHHLFLNGEEVTDLVIPSEISRIREYAFAYCTGLTSLTIPNSVKHIDQAAFNACSSLTSVIVEWETPVSISSNTFSNRANATLYVPAGSKAAYEAADYWKDFGTIVEMETYIVGDANTDQRVDVADFVAVAHYLLERTPENFHMKAADANQDDNVDVADLTAIAHLKLYGTINKPTEESPAKRFVMGAEADTENYIYVDPISVDGESEITLSVKMKNAVEAEGFAFDLYLPEGMSFVTNNNGFVEASLSTERTTARKTNSFNAVIRQDGSLRVLAASSNGSSISGNDGEVALVTIHIDSSLTAGEYLLQLKNIAISDVDAVSHRTELLESIITILGSGITTGIDGIKDQNENAEWYTMDGRRLSGKPKTKGVYITNGKKVTVK